MYQNITLRETGKGKDVQKNIWGNVMGIFLWDDKEHQEQNRGKQEDNWG